VKRFLHAADTGGISCGDRVSGGKKRFGAVHKRAAGAMEKFAVSGYENGVNRGAVGGVGHGRAQGSLIAAVRAGHQQQNCKCANYREPGEKSAQSTALGSGMRLNSLTQAGSNASGSGHHAGVAIKTDDILRAVQNAGAFGAARYMLVNFGAEGG